MVLLVSMVKLGIHPTSFWFLGKHPPAPLGLTGLPRSQVCLRLVQLSAINGVSFYSINIPNGTLRTNKVLMRVGFIYPQSQLINYLYETLKTSTYNI
jgi:hypothetical protein